ncbi:MAG: SsrA-binding protein SmpB [Oscillospiraceae bacterium]
MADNKVIAVNRKARHDYFVLEGLETGIELVGTEVKSIRAGEVNLKDAWVEVTDGELYVMGMHISPYEKGNIFNRDPIRPRKLLAHKREIRHLQEERKLQGLALIPLQLYFKGSNVKMELGLCKGKKLYDKRADMAERDAKRDIDRAMKEQYR